MIPSVNRQDVGPDDYPKMDWSFEKWDAFRSKSEAKDYICDCCMKHVGEVPRKDVFGVLLDIGWDPRLSPRLVLVGGVTYWACSTECARILFNIHHQYAMKLHL